MDGYCEQFCTVLRAGLWGLPVDIELSPSEMFRIWKDAEKQAVDGIVAEAFLSTNHIPPKTSEILKKRMLSIASKNLKLNSVLKDSVRALNNHGIMPVLLKGQGVGSYYNQPLTRACGDIDLYVGTEAYKKSFDVLKESLSNVVEADFDPNDKHSHLYVNDIPIEIHQFSDRLPTKYNTRFQVISDSCLSSGHVVLRFGDVDVRTPEPTFNSFYIFNHLWRHFIAVGVGFRQICDWTVFLHANSDRIDVHRLDEILNSLDLMKPWKTFGLIAVKMLGLPASEMPFHDPSFEKDVDKILRMIMLEGNLGKEREDRWRAAEKGTFLNKLKVFIISTKRYLKVFPMFPGLAFQEYMMRIKNNL